MEYMDFAMDLARRAGAVIKTNFALGMKKEWKADNTPLTITDTTINQMVIDAVKSRFPDHKILAEEGSDMSGTSEYVWVCDPVDGTIPFSHGVPTCAFSLALVKDGESILGVAYDPFMDRMFTAEKGKGAFLNGTSIKVSKATSMPMKVFGMGGWGSDFFDGFTVGRKIRGTHAKLVALYSIVYTGMLVASGEFVGAIFSGNTAHDCAALKVLVEEAGGKVTDLWGEDQRYDQKLKGCLMTNGILHDELLGIIRESLLKDGSLGK